MRVSNGATLSRGKNNAKVPAGRSNLSKWKPGSQPNQSKLYILHTGAS